MTEHEKFKICKKAIKQGFYGNLWGSVDNPRANREREQLYFEDLEIVRYKDHSIAGIAVPSFYSAEGWLAVWDIANYGNDWRLLTDEEKKMTNLEHLIENGMIAMEQSSSYEEWLKKVESDANLPYVTITLAELWEICQYFEHDWCYNCDKQKDIVHCKVCRHRCTDACPRYTSENGGKDDATDDGFCDLGEEYNSWDDFDWCYECTGYGDDYSVNDDGELVSNCENCPHNKSNSDD